MNSKDPNLVYLGLQVFRDITEKDLTFIKNYRSYIMQCFSLEDPSIRNRALDIIKITTTKQNLEAVVKELMTAT